MPRSRRKWSGILEKGQKGVKPGLSGAPPQNAKVVAELASRYYVEIRIAARIRELASPYLSLVELRRESDNEPHGSGKFRSDHKIPQRNLQFQCPISNKSQLPSYSRRQPRV